MLGNDHSRKHVSGPNTMYFSLSMGKFKISFLLKNKRKTKHKANGLIQHKTRDALLLYKPQSLFRCTNSDVSECGFIPFI